MSSVKEQARRLLEELPDDLSWHELRLEIEVREKIERGLQDVAAGRTRPAGEIEAKYGFKD
jgi:hypothetical protein